MQESLQDFYDGMRCRGSYFAGISQKAGYFRLAKPGKILSIIGMSLSALFWIIGIIISATGDYYYYY